MKMVLKATLLVAVMGVALVASGCCGRVVVRDCPECCIDCNDYYAPGPMDVALQ